MRSVTVLIFLCALAPAVWGQRIGDELLGDASVGEWWSSETRTRLEGNQFTDVQFSELLTIAQGHLDELIDGPFASCAGLGSVEQRACLMASNLRRYQNYLANDQNCRIDAVLMEVDDRDAEASAIDAELARIDITANNPLAGEQLFLPTFVPLGGSYLLFESATLNGICGSPDPLRLDMIRVPAASEATTDKLILGYAYVITLRNWEYNRPYAEATAARIAEANTRWLNFQRNVIEDQFPWETLLFNDWLARGSSRFTGTLMEPPTQQLRVLHPVPVAVLDTDAKDTLFRPRLTIEVIGLRTFDRNNDYRAKRGLSLIATLKADADESNGWGLLYSFRRGSIGIVSQEIGNEDVIGLVFGIDLANQIDSRANELMEDWAELRMRLESIGQNR